MSLLEHFALIPDFRRNQGKRYDLAAMLTLITLAMMSGRSKYREIERFGKRHAEYLTDILGLKHGVPSNVTIREILRRVDFGALQRQFNLWASENLSPGQGESLSERLVALDGKALRATVKDYSQSGQDFVCFLHAFAAERNLLLHAERYENGHQSELALLQEMVERLRGCGCLLTMDAVHAQKNGSRNHRDG